MGGRVGQAHGLRGDATGGAGQARREGPGRPPACCLASLLLLPCAAPSGYRPLTLKESSVRPKHSRKVCRSFSRHPVSSCPLPCACAGELVASAQS